MAIPNQTFIVGRASHRVHIQAPLGVLDEAVAVNVDTDVPVMIDVLPPAFQANENLALGGLQTQTKYNVTCRYREDVRASYVLLEQCHTQRTFQILSVIPSDKHDNVQMTCVTHG